MSYAPIIESKPNDMSTVFTTMKRCVDMTKAMGQVHSVQTFDQQLYAIAKQVEWAITETFRNRTVRLGVFNTLSCYIAAIGKLWGDGGLKYLLVDSSVYAAGTVDHMLNGKEFNRATRAFALAYEALSVSWSSAFFSWCNENDLIKSFSDNYWSDLSEVAVTFPPKPSTNETRNVATSAIDNYMFPLMDDFRKRGCSESPTFKCWDMFLNAIEIMLQNIRSERDGLWKLHLSSVSAMLSFMFVTNRVNNSRWLPVYILDMFNLAPATNDMLQTHKPLNLNFGTFYEV